MKTVAVVSLPNCGNIQRLVKLKFKIDPVYKSTISFQKCHTKSLCSFKVIKIQIGKYFACLTDLNCQ